MVSVFWATLGGVKYCIIPGKNEGFARVAETNAMPREEVIIA